MNTCTSCHQALQLPQHARLPSINFKSSVRQSFIARRQHKLHPQQQRQRASYIVTRAELTTELQYNDPIGVVLFGLAIAALSVVTLGVAYLSFLSWRDDTEEKAAQAKMKGSPTALTPAPSGTQQQSEKAGKQAAAAPKKGFGRKK